MVGAAACHTPLCPAGHLPPKGGDRLDAPLVANRKSPSILRVGHQAKHPRNPISPLEGEMSGRTEGGAAPGIQTEEHAMPHAPVPPQRRANAKRMRKTLTDAELKLWNELRAHRLMGLGFRRQLPIAGYIVDFACPSHRLIIELDGSQHANELAADYDSVRTRRLQTAGWTVIRFWNDDVLRDIDNVCLHILATIGRRVP